MINENGRYYRKLMNRALGLQSHGYGSHNSNTPSFAELVIQESKAELNILEEACILILDLSASLDEHPKLFYEFHPFVRSILLKDEYIPLFHDVDEHKELNAAKVEIEALKAELAEAKEKLAAIEAEKTKTKNTLESELASVLTPPAYNPFD
jgi:hypothetical protein